MLFAQSAHTHTHTFPSFVLRHFETEEKEIHVSSPRYRYHLALEGFDIFDVVFRVPQTFI